MSSALHTRSALDHDIAEIRNDILRMGSLVEEQIAKAVRALKDRDLSLAHQVIESDQRINALRYRVESGCVRTIAMQQPAAKDLRCIVAAIHMAGELERIADHASGIAAIAIRIGDEPLVKPLIDIPRMQAIACEMIRNALDAFVQMDVEAAKAIFARDQEVDELYVQVLRELLTFMMQDAKTIAQSTYLLWVAHNLERIADRATNLCERVIFAVTAELGDYKPRPVE
ncbi:MAG: phosphate transport system regulatory protein PhoU [Chloroflexi bacterium]|jgi:phosphate transport system protein|uniref:Phosphate-specific transport system accessory protein PhoU n=1 Tax=Candidatus Thermofonsia Clade 3 bacterium TaxID=2364212 RepID=A0A2M8QE62_9CHLR|nr:phosphate signaling complex protein PhoU [Candidatus Roseilinea sp. NK_OTU-006]PJF48042.1 MAG: phosphate transport system regulatory protein PhoU [Candidatus Thermofonsia Clade 3 bacterium]RMG63806.1 MAG: phosphate transport system regulatory protein PhoU [Chloroflexota bacterium]